jgi:hypothetical protein
MDDQEATYGDSADLQTVWLIATVDHGDGAQDTFHYKATR